jgi:hypothetical protein
MSLSTRRYKERTGQDLIRTEEFLSFIASLYAIYVLQKRCDTVMRGGGCRFGTADRLPSR